MPSLKDCSRSVGSSAAHAIEKHCSAAKRYFIATSRIISNSHPGPKSSLGDVIKQLAQTTLPPDHHFVRNCGRHAPVLHPPSRLSSTRRRLFHHPCKKLITGDCAPSYPGDTPVPWFKARVKCSKCECGGRWVDVRAYWQEAYGSRDCGGGRQCQIVINRERRRRY